MNILRYYIFSLPLPPCSTFWLFVTIVLLKTFPTLADLPSFLVSWISSLSLRFACRVTLGRYIVSFTGPRAVRLLLIHVVTIYEYAIGSFPLALLLHANGNKLRLGCEDELESRACEPGVGRRLFGSEVVDKQHNWWSLGGPGSPRRCCPYVSPVRRLICFAYKVADCRCEFDTIEVSKRKSPLFPFDHHVSRSSCSLYRVD